MKTICAYKTFQDIAKKIASENNIKYGEITFDNFKDGWPNIKIENVDENIEGNDIYYIADISTPDKLFENLATIQAITRYFARKLNVIIPFYPVGTMERVSEEGEVATAKTLARLLSSTPSGQEAITTFHTFDIHDVRERFYTSDNISFRLHSAMDLIKQKIENIENLGIVFPDEGANKRFGKDFKCFDQVIATKIRNGDKRIITIKEGEVQGKNLVIVDDLIQSGSTIIETAKKLREMGAASVSCYATHGVFPEKSYENLAKYLDKVYITDTIRDQKEGVENIENIAVVGIKELVERIVRR